LAGSQGTVLDPAAIADAQDLLAGRRDRGAQRLCCFRDGLVGSSLDARVKAELSAALGIPGNRFEDRG